MTVVVELFSLGRGFCSYDPPLFFPGSSERGQAGLGGGG